MKNILAAFVISFFLVSCKKEKDDFVLKTFIVAPQKGIYTGWWGGTATSLLVKEDPADPFYILGQDIEGFNHVEGFEYKIEVRQYEVADPPADGSSVRYVLNKIISKQ